MDLKKQVEAWLIKYYQSFSQKNYNSENNDTDFLMDVFNITPELKRQNRQYWGRELGMLWQKIVTDIAKFTCKNDYHPALKIGDDEPCDLIIGTDAIDTKYRIGSGDSGTLKKFKQYGQFLLSKGYTPVFLILRTDNLPAAITAAQKGGWNIYIGQDAINYIYNKTGVNIVELLASFGDKYYLTNKH